MRAVDIGWFLDPKHVCSVKCSLRLLNLNQDQLPYLAHQNSHSMAERGKSSWAGRVRELLLRYEFREAWYNQGVENENQFLGIFFQRLKDRFGKKLVRKTGVKQQVSRIKQRFILKQRFGLEEYKCTMKGNFRNALPNFRAGVFWGKKHSFGFTLGSDTASSFCPDQKEDEVHVLCECTKQDNMRPDF